MVETTHINKHILISVVEFYTKWSCALRKNEMCSVKGYIEEAIQRNCRRLS